MKDVSKYGHKHKCWQCECKFYDLNRPKAICPKCGADQADARKGAAARPAEVSEAVAPEVDVDAADAADAAEDVDTDDAAEAFDDDDFPALDDTDDPADDLDDD